MFFSEHPFHAIDAMMRVMPQKKVAKQSAETLLAVVRKEMARPRVAESAHKKIGKPRAVPTKVA